MILVQRPQRCSPGVVDRQKQMDWFNELQRRTTSLENATRLRHASLGIDVTDLLARVSVPILILHSRGDVVAPLTKSE